MLALHVSFFPLGGSVYSRGEVKEECIKEDKLFLKGNQFWTKFEHKRMQAIYEGSPVLDKGDR